MSTNSDLKERYPRIDDPAEAINFALDSARLDRYGGAVDFLEAWREGDWTLIAQAYPDFLVRVDIV